MSHVLRVGQSAPIMLFVAINADNTPKTDLAHNTAGLTLAAYRIGLAEVQIGSAGGSPALTAKATDQASWSPGAVRQIVGNLYSVDVPTAAVANQCPSIGVRGSWTAESGGRIEPVPHSVVGYDATATAVGANTTTPPTTIAIASQVRTELSTELGRLDAAISTRSTFAGLGASAPANWIAAASIADNAFTAAKFASGAFDPVWTVSSRTLSAFAFSVTVGTNNDKTGYGLAADQAVNVTKVGGTAVAGPNDLKADLSGIPAAVWGASLAGYGAGTAGLALTSAGSAGDPWSTTLPGAYGAGTAGYLIGTNVDSPISSVSGGGGVADWTADQKTAIMAILGIPASGTTPTDPTVGILDAIRDGVGGVPAAVWANATRTLSSFGFSVTVGTNTDKSGYGLAADQAVNVTKVGGNLVASPDDFKADITGIPTAVWGHGSRSLTSSVTVGGYESGQSPATLVDLSGIPAAVWGHSVRTLSAFGFSVTVGGYESGQSPASQLNVSSLAAKTDLPTGFSGMLINGSGQVSASNVSVTVNPTTLDPAAVSAIQGPILAAIAVIAPGAADYAIKLEVKYQGNGVANTKVAITGTTAAAFTDSNGLAQLNVSADTVYTVRVTPPNGYQFVADFAVSVTSADVTVPITLVANALPAVVPPLRVTYDEIRRHVGRFLGFGANPDVFDASQSSAVEDTIRQGLRDVYFPSINGAPYEWSFLKRYTELQFSGGSTFALPTSFVRLASQVTVPGLGYPLRQVSESALRSMAIDSTEQGAPVYYALSADGDALQLGVTLYQMRLFPSPPAGTGHAELWYHTSPEIDLTEGGPLGGIDLAATIIECCLARAELAQNVESLGQGGGVHLARSQEMLRRSIEADRDLQAETFSVSMADQMRPPQQ